MLSVQELKEETIDPLLDYWMSCSPEYLLSLGAISSKMPTREQFRKTLEEQIKLEYRAKSSYALVWCLNNIPIGHSNVNKIIFGEHAYMHLHIWLPEHRRKGYGSELIKIGLPLFFKNLELKTLYCEPYSLNEAPNKTLVKAGFSFVNKYITIPGSLNFKQMVHLYEIKKDKIV